jgi:hypothetical protein
VRLPVQRRHEPITGFTSERRRVTGAIQRSKQNKGSIRVEDTWSKTERKACLTAYLWQSDKSIVVSKAAKVAGAKGAWLLQIYLGENNLKGND